MTDLVRPLSVLLGVQVALGAITWWPSPASIVEVHPLVEGGAEALTEIRIRAQGAADPVVLQRDGEVWRVASAHGYPAESTRVSKVTEALGAASIGRAVTTRATSHERLGVGAGNAERVVTFSTAEAGPTTVLLGAAGRERVHLRFEGDDPVYAVDGFGVFALRGDDKGYLPTRALEVSADTVQRFEISTANASAAFVRETDDRWGLVGAPERVATQTFSELLDKATRLRLDAVVAAQAAPEHGLRSDAAIQVSWGLSPDSTSGSYTVGRGDGDSVNVQVDGVPQVISVRRAHLAPLLDTPLDQLHRPRRDDEQPSGDTDVN